MKKIKISHEVPLIMLEESRVFNDYDYALVHLFTESKAYYEFYKDSLKRGREVYLDNSVFELGEAYNEKEYSQWIEKLEPTYFIIPDVLEDTDATIKNVIRWKNVPWKKIGVIQGKTLNDIIKCYEKIEPHVDMIAFNFSLSLYQQLISYGDIDMQRTQARPFLLKWLNDRSYINKEKKHHLLGMSLPQELNLIHHYKLDFIDSIDTSNPVIHGHFGIKYEHYGLIKKITTKMVDIFYEDIKNVDIIEHNIKTFRKMAHNEHKIDPKFLCKDINYYKKNKINKKLV